LHKVKGCWLWKCSFLEIFVVVTSISCDFNLRTVVGLCNEIFFGSLWTMLLGTFESTLLLL